MEVSIRIADDEKVLEWSHGEVVSADTLNYMTERPVVGGLMCERIFGPTRRLSCACGIVVGKANEGEVCSQCHVLCGDPLVRRERMGHIELASPVVHVWLLKSAPGRLAALLGLRPGETEAVVYFGRYLITRVSERLRESLAAEGVDVSDVILGATLSESRFRELTRDLPPFFTAGMGAEAIRERLADLDVARLCDELRDELEEATGQNRKNLLRRLAALDSYRHSGERADAMIFRMMPVLPPELRPMIPLSGGRYAASDVNDLYRRVLNRNKRLKRLLSIDAPEVVVRNERRMLQEAVDAVYDNGRRGKAVLAPNEKPMRSLAHMLKGKRGRFRQNLLGKRVDYSGRSVIVAGPEYAFHEVGLPKKMALELFRPLVMNALLVEGIAQSKRHASRLVDRPTERVWKVVKEVSENRPVLLNRAPTLHRLGMQAFYPRLVEDKAIHLHPMVCTGFNADFDGDQMAVHIPLSPEAVAEAEGLMLSHWNLLSPSSGEAISAPTLDVVLGVWYATVAEEASGEARRFVDVDDALRALEMGVVGLREPVAVRMDGEMVETTCGRILFNRTAPPEAGIEYINDVVGKGRLGDLTIEVYEALGNVRTARFLDALKDFGFGKVTESGISMSVADIKTPAGKEATIAAAERRVEELRESYYEGIITEEEEYLATLDVWNEAVDSLTDEIKDNLADYGGVYMMAESGAKGNLSQIKQMAGMRGLMANPRGETIARPVKSNFRAGLSVIEYFISTHGARKGLSDTALRTADSGYLTRKLVDVAHDIVITELDCGSDALVEVCADEWGGDLPSFGDELLSRTVGRDVVDAGGEVVVESGEGLDYRAVSVIERAGVEAVWTRTPSGCLAERGLCAACYGLSLGTLLPVELGEPVGVIAAQSIGEPGTQLTMRTFHTGGVAGADITSGLPRVIELFEARNPKGAAVTTDMDGVATVVNAADGARWVSVERGSRDSVRFEVAGDAEWEMGEGFVGIGEVVARLPDGSALASPASGELRRVSGGAEVSWSELDVREYEIPAAAQLCVEDGDEVRAGDALTVGSLDLRDLVTARGVDETRRYIVRDVQRVYRSQGVPTHSKHVEIIVERMLMKVRVLSGGDSELLPDSVVYREEFDAERERVAAGGGEPPTCSDWVEGITNAALGVPSFLSAASFQETTRLLTDAAFERRSDPLLGLKENVIMGNLIPAKRRPSTERFDDGMGR